MTITRDALEELRGKYAEMLRLRLAHDAGAEDDPRRHMASLAARFPGSLREIDELPLDEIRGRIRALADAASDPPRAARWMIAMALFHELLRGALCAKRWLAGRREVDAAVRADFDRESAALCYGAEARAWSASLERLASPPRGRVTELVYERMASMLAITAVEARTLVFGESRRARRAGAAGGA